MKNDDLYMLYVIVIFLLILLGTITIKFTDRMDQLDNKLDELNKKLSAVPEPFTLTYATVTDATPDEPDEVSKELRPEFLTSESVQKASEQPLEVVAEEIATEEPESVPEASEEATDILSEASERVYLGSYELTAYAWTGNPCANGNYPSCGYTVASNTIPLGSRIYIEGYGEYVVEDRGGMPSNVIDVYMGDYDSCIQFGRRSANVYLIE